MGPSAARASATAGLGASVVGQVRADGDRRCRPPAVISSATACASSRARSTTATRAPSAANRRAVARPMPLAAPVTTATAAGDGSG